MKKFSIFLLLSLFFVGMIAVLPSCKKTETEKPLTSIEKKDLLFMREEEKLARDVYLYAYDKYGMEIFKNISSAEQTHMDAILTLLNKYNLPDPAKPQRGVFSDSTLQNLYNFLVATVDSSAVKALIVGATIEDKDIEDLQVAIDSAQHDDIIDTYKMLQCGSRNHLRAFYKQIVDSGATYTPQYISESEFNSIVNSDRERCGSGK